MNIMNIFRRIFRIGASEVHSAIDALENPIKMTEQGIRDLKQDLDSALHSLAEVKAMAIRAGNDRENSANKASEYEKKAMMLLQRAQRSEISSDEADRLASEALVQKAHNEKDAAQSAKDEVKFNGSMTKLESQVKRLRSMIGKYESELKTLKARAKVTSATKNLNKQLAEIDSSSTVAMLERMRDKVEAEEALAESYGEIADEARTLDDEIDKALESNDEATAAESLKALKEKMGV